MPRIAGFPWPEYPSDNAIADGRVHGEEDFADQLVGVGRVALAHLVNGASEQSGAVENVGVFGEEAKHQSRHEVVHGVTAFRATPFGVVLQQFSVELVEPAGSADVERASVDLADGGDTGKRQEKAEVVRKVGVATRHRFAGLQVFRLETHSICGKDEAGLGLVCGAAIAQRYERLRDFARCRDLDVDIARLQDAAHVRLIRCAVTASSISTAFMASPSSLAQRHIQRHRVIGGLLKAETAIKRGGAFVLRIDQQQADAQT